MPGLTTTGGLLNTAFHDLDARCFPFTIEFLDKDETIVHTITVTEPGVIRIPPVAKTHGPVSVRVSYATGEVITQPAPG